MKRPVLASAGITALSLVGGLFAGAAIGVLFEERRFHAAEQTIIFLICFLLFGGGALWGYLLARIHNLPNRLGISLASALSFGLAVIGAVTLLGILERVLVEQHRLSGVPIHVIFTMLFVPMEFLVATIGSAVILIVSGNRARWFLSAITTGVTAALSFMLVDLLLDALGFRVGAPRAAEHATMLTVAFLGSSVAAFSACAILGRLLSAGTAHICPNENIEQRISAD